MQPALSEPEAVLAAVRDAFAGTDGPWELIRIADLDLVSPPSGYDEVTVSVLLPHAAVLTDETVEMLEEAGWALCVHLPNGALTRVRPGCHRSNS